MKRFLSILLLTMLTFSLTACSYFTKKESDKDQSVAVSALDLLSTVWDSYGDDERFPVSGGDMSEENLVVDGPGKFDTQETDGLDATLGFPASSAFNIDDAASLVHMMNANTFTCGVYHVESGNDNGELTNAIRDNILKRQWMCGFPDKLIIVEIDDYIVSFFGEKSIVNTFLEKISAVYPTAVKVCERSIS